MAAGLAVNTLLLALGHGLETGLKLGLLSSLAGGLLLLLVFGLLGAIRFVGMGDVKLMAAVGALLRWPAALWALAYVALAGGVLALAYALWKGRLRRVLGNIFAIGQRAVRPGKAGGEEIQLHRIPYALAIFIGATWAAAIKYWPWLALG